MRKNNLKKRRNIFEVLGIKQDNKKWLVLAITIILTGYLLFSLIYAPISCIKNIKASAEGETYTNVNGEQYKIVYTIDEQNRFVVELPTIYNTLANRYVFTTTTIKYIMNTNNEELMLLNPQKGINRYELYNIASNYQENINVSEVMTLNLYTIKYDLTNQTPIQAIQNIPYKLYRQQVGQIDLTKVNSFNITQDPTNASKTIGFKIVCDENNYIEYWIGNGNAFKPYWDIQNQTIFEINKGIFVYEEGSEITGPLAKDYWKQYFLNNETFKETYKDYWYDYYYQKIYNEGLDAGQTYSEFTFYSLIDAITFGAIKPLYSMLNFELLGINMWNLAGSLFTVLVVVVIIKIIGWIL